jgi:dipeptidase E
MQVLAFSSSRVGSGGYLESAAPVIEKFLGNKALNIAFIPFALVDKNYDSYADNVRKGLTGLPYNIQNVTPENAASTIANADVIMVGGGNTFKLLHDLYLLNLMELIKEKVHSETPFIGWSAGSNIAGVTICTSNDMPIINPGSFNALGFFPFQINPHYYNQPVTGFNGETRNQRLTEFVQLNPKMPVVGLPEGTALLLKDGKLTLIGDSNAVLFGWDEGIVTQKELNKDNNLSFLL